MATVRGVFESSVARCTLKCARRRRRRVALHVKSGGRRCGDAGSYCFQEGAWMGRVVGGVDGEVA